MGPGHVSIVAAAKRCGMHLRIKNEIDSDVEFALACGRRNFEKKSKSETDNNYK